MPPSIGFFSITVCNTTSLLYTSIYILSFSVIWKKMWPISSEEIYSQTNVSVNEPPSLLSWHKLHFCSAHHTAGSQELSSKPLYDFHCSFFSCFSSYPPLSYGPALVYVASRSRLQPYWAAVRWEWIVGFEFLLWFKAGQSTAEQHNAAYYPPWAWSAAAARVIANTTGASASSKSKPSVVLRRHYVFRERERASMLIYQKWLQHWMCVVCFEDRSYHPHLTK